MQTCYIIVASSDSHISYISSMYPHLFHPSSFSDFPGSPRKRKSSPGTHRMSQEVAEKSQEVTIWV